MRTPRIIYPPLRISFSRKRLKNLRDPGKLAKSLVQFEIQFPENGIAAVNLPWFKSLYAIYLGQVLAEENVAKKIALKQRYLALFGSVNNVDEIGLDDMQQRVAAISMQMACISAFNLGRDTSVQEQASSAADQLLKERQAKGGKLSGIVRSKNAERWIPHATKLAIHLRAEQPSLSQQALAALIVDLWGTSEAPVGTDSILKLIGKLEHNGTLPKKFRERGGSFQ